MSDNDRKRLTEWLGEQLCLKEIEKRLRDAANGPWIHGDKGLYYKNVTDSGYYWQRLSDLPANDELLAHMHEDMNFLIAEVKRLREANAIEHDRFLSALSDCQNKDFEIERLREELGSANDAIVLLKTRLKQLQKTVEIEHDQGESFLTQIKELITDRDRLPINIILDAPPSHDSGRFVEVETDDGKSIRAGEWIEKDGYWALRITELPKAIDAEMDSEWEIEFIR